VEGAVLVFEREVRRGIPCFERDSHG
jgi:hypothetical protein